MAKKKKKSNTPKRKKLKQSARLQSAKNWILKYEGEHIVRGYKNWFGVDELCALLELKKLGIEISEDRIKEARIKLERIKEIRKKQKEEKKGKQLQSQYADSNEEFSYIAGYTAGGAPYGVTWEELEKVPPDWSEIY